MKLKNFLSVAAISLCLLTSCALDNPSGKTNSDLEYPEFVKVYEKSNTFDNSSYSYLYDPTSKVMYMWIEEGRQAGLTPLYNEDGTLRKYEE